MLTPHNETPARTRPHSNAIAPTSPAHPGKAGRAASQISLLRAALLALAASTLTLSYTATANAKTYATYQCAPGIPAVSPGWSTYAFNSQATTGLADTCATGGNIGDEVSSNESIGVVTEKGNSGSQVGIALDVPATTPDVTIKAITAKVIASSVTGDDAFLGFASAGQSLPGAVELPYASGQDYTATDTWTLPQGARDFEAYVNCSTDHSSSSCSFADASRVPALSDIELTLEDDTPPAITSASGGLATAAANGSPITGSQTLSFAASDTDSGIRSATLTLTPQGGGAPYTHTFDFSSQCAYDSWNACPLTQAVSGFTLNTATLKDDSYTASLTATDAAGNEASDPLGTINSHNAPANTSAPTILVPGQILPGAALTAEPGTWTAPAETGTITYTYQWEQCDSQGNNCQPIEEAQKASYTPTTADIGDTLRTLVSAADNDGTTLATSPPTSQIVSAANTLGTPSGTGEDNPQNPATPGPGAPNGTNASEAAQLNLSEPASISRSFTRRALELTGRLLNNVGDPIENATLAITQQIAGSATTQAIADARTGSSGAFTVRVPAGPTRLIEVAYRAFSTDAAYTAQAQMHETVSPGIRLKIITPRHASPTETITLTGTVQGPIPPQGTIVELLVYYRGHWEPFRTPRTKPDGHFADAYQFEGSIGHFPFRAEVPAGQQGFPYTNGRSKIINVTT
jgi:hypothetical protein